MKIQNFFNTCTEKCEDKSIKNKKHCKVRCYCHYTSEYRAAAHSTCNLKYSVPKSILIVFHSDLSRWFNRIRFWWKLKEEICWYI